MVSSTPGGSKALFNQSHTVKNVIQSAAAFGVMWAPPRGHPYFFTRDLKVKFFHEIFNFVSGSRGSRIVVMFAV
jgi:hypothetical protein